jgi:adenylyltransferase/sulfurtransferase
MTAAPPAVALREDQIRRYARHVLLPDVGGRGQERLLAAAVAVEVGGAAEIAALAYLAAAGVGRIALTGAVRAPVSEAEAKLGILYGTGDIGRPRIDVIRDRVAALNGDVAIVEEADGAVALADELVGAQADSVADALWLGGSAAARILARIARR